MMTAAQKDALIKATATLGDAGLDLCDLIAFELNLQATEYATMQNENLEGDDEPCSVNSIAAGLLENNDWVDGIMSDVRACYEVHFCAQGETL